MKVYSKKDLKEYLKDDWVLERLKKYPQDTIFASHQWLLDLSEKRLIYADIYGDLFKSRGKKILDVGGGFCGLSRELIKRHDYTLLDIMTHDDSKKLKNIEKREGKFWTNSNWDEFKLDKKYDFVIANDLFPNVDQRLKKFIKKFKPYDKKIILTLTCHEGEREYKLKRVDADEIITIVPWNAAMTSIAIGKKLLPKKPELSIFKNGRTVYRINL